MRGPRPCIVVSTELDPEGGGEDRAGERAAGPCSALEVIEITGRPLLRERGVGFVRQRLRPDARRGRTRERDDLYERVAARVDRMFERGLVEEVEGLAGRLGTNGAAGARLQADPRRAGRVHGGVAGRDRASNQEVRPPPGVVVPRRPSHRVVRGDVSRPGGGGFFLSHGDGLRATAVSRLHLPLARVSPAVPLRA